MITPTPLRLRELRAVAAKERERLGDRWFDMAADDAVRDHALAALRKIQSWGLFAVVPTEDGREVAQITRTGREVLHRWENPPRQTIHRTRPREAALAYALRHRLWFEPGSYASSFLHADDRTLVRPYLRRALGELLAGGLVAAPEVPGPVSVTDLGCEAADRWGVS